MDDCRCPQDAPGGANGVVFAFILCSMEQLTTPHRRPPHLRVARRRRVARLAAQQGGVASRPQVYALGITRAEVRANIRAGRWRRVHTQGLAVHTGPVEPVGRWWAAVFEAGPRAHLDGESSLLAAGLQGYEARAVRVSVPRGARVRRARGLDVRQTRRWDPEQLVAHGVPRTRNAVAAVRAALWATSDRQAALLLTMTVQQGLAEPAELGAAVLAVKRDKRRLFVSAVILDLMGGVRSLGELDFARECRARGLPEPTRQVIRRGRNGSYYLDVWWEHWGVLVEIDGIHHTWAQNVVGDSLRHNDLALDRSVVLRLPLLGLRVAPDDFFDQITKALVDAGCPVRSHHSA